MESALLTLFSLVSFLFLCVGGVIGWIVKTHIVETTPRMGFTHPELFDDKGNLIPDEVLALKIHPGFMDEFDAEYSDLFEEDDED
jgi:hypothetical protein